MRLQGPSRAILRDFMVRGGQSNAIGIVIENADQPNSRVYIQQPYANVSQQSSLLVDGVDYTRVDLRGFINQVSSGSSIKVVGGRDLGGRTTLVAGASANNNLSYEVTQGGRLAAKDVWYETGGDRLGFIRLTGNSAVTLALARVFTAPVNTAPPSS